MLFNSSIGRAPTMRGEGSEGPTVLRFGLSRDPAFMSIIISK